MPTPREEIQNEQTVRGQFQDMIGSFEADNKDIIGGFILGRLDKEQQARVLRYAEGGESNRTCVRLHIARYVTTHRKAWHSALETIKGQMDHLYVKDPALARVFTECTIDFLGEEAPEARAAITAHGRAWEMSQYMVERVRNSRLSLDN